MFFSVNLRYKFVGILRRLYWNIIISSYDFGTGICNNIQWLGSASALQIRRPALHRAQFIEIGLREKNIEPHVSKVHWLLMMKFTIHILNWWQRSCDNWHVLTTIWKFTCESILGSRHHLKSPWVCCAALIQPVQWCPVPIPLEILAVAYPIFSWMLMPNFLMILKSCRSIGG